MDCSILHSRFVSLLRAFGLLSDCVTDRACVDKRGNRVLIAITVLNMALYFGAYLFYSGINKRRDKIWNSWTAKVRLTSIFLTATFSDVTAAGTTRVPRYD